LAPRVTSPEVRDGVRAQTLVNPVAHRARVLLPAMPGEEGPLFAPLEQDVWAGAEIDIAESRVVGA